GPKFLPIIRRIHVKERIGQDRGIIERPLQRNLPRLAGKDGCDDWSVPGDQYIELQVPSVLDVNRFEMSFWSYKPLRCLNLLVAIEVLDEEILNVWPKIGESPCDALVMTHHDEWQSRQRQTCDVVIATMEMSFIPSVWYLVCQMHVIAQEWLAAGRMLA